MKRFLAAVCAVVLVAACSSAARTVTISLPASALFDAPLGLSVTGLTPGQKVVLNATTGGWISSATFIADRSGRVDPASAAPVSGSCAGAHEAGLLWSMTSGDEKALGDSFTLRVTASLDGKQVASASSLRLLKAQDVTASAAGFFSPGNTDPRPAVLVFGGSEGGSGTGAAIARALASKGYPALGIAYFRAPGLPDSLSAIPLEYFADAVRRLARQPGVDNTWPSCPYANAIAARLGDHPHTLLSATGAGHLAGVPIPGLPLTPTAQLGGTQQADALAAEDAWPKLLAFLAAA